MSSELSLNRPSAFLPAAGWIAWPGRSQVRLTGADRAKFLHNFCTNDIKKLQPGQGCEAFLTSIKGRILGHIFVFAGSDDLVIDTVPGEDVKIRDHLDRFLITEDVQIEVITERSRCVYLFGRDWPALLQAGLGLDLAPLGPFGHVTAKSRPVTVRRFDVTAAQGFELVIPHEAVESVVSAFEFPDPERPRPVQVSATDFEAWRIDAGFPMYGVDLSDEHLAQEAARTQKAISFTKGCYLGQEPIARIDALGHVNRESRLVAFENSAGLKAPVKVVLASTQADVGTLSSVGRVDGSATVAIGMLRTTATLGSAIRAVGEAGEFMGEVVTPALADGARAET
ncbi:glycine cleavage system aminomethyltransferase T [Caulifigura coniformis]|uniref:Glycine cleavage system aminomethyltransferase T n=1 Tax=Caulifigura coniformis TaxID=2527983 RepID=A0A517SHH7_9PLAN|nr:hypothetical protein [Caulifigura coniformis]QDT55547.1 glycine cleavage system aminomethyltransferase T [Caulifigura coniformis]